MIKRGSIPVTWAILVAVPAALAQAPVLTDEFDAFLVTAETKICEVVGVIRPVFENPKKIGYELIAPVPGGDRRGYLKQGQLDATKIVAIDRDTGEIRLTKPPSTYPGNHYAEVPLRCRRRVAAVSDPPTRSRRTERRAHRLAG